MTNQPVLCLSLTDSVVYHQRMEFGWDWLGSLSALNSQSHQSIQLALPQIRSIEVLVIQSCLTLCDPMDCSLPGSSVHRILQAKILEWVVFPSPGHLPTQGSNLGSPALQADSLPSESPRKVLYQKRWNINLLLLFFKLYGKYCCERNLITSSGFLEVWVFFQKPWRIWLLKCKNCMTLTWRVWMNPVSLRG